MANVLIFGALAPCLISFAVGVGQVEDPATAPRSKQHPARTTRADAEKSIAVALRDDFGVERIQRDEKGDITHIELSSTVFLRSQLILESGHDVT